MHPAIVNEARGIQQRDNGYMQQDEFHRFFPVQQTRHQYGAIQIIKSNEEKEEDGLLDPIFFWKGESDRQRDMGYENKAQERPEKDVSKYGNIFFTEEHQLLYSGAKIRFSYACEKYNQPRGGGNR